MPRTYWEIKEGIATVEDGKVKIQWTREFTLDERQYRLHRPRNRYIHFKDIETFKTWAKKNQKKL